MRTFVSGLGGGDAASVHAVEAGAAVAVHAALGTVGLEGFAQSVVPVAVPAHRAFGVVNATLLKISNL